VFLAYKFTGKERDSESGLDNFGACYYSSTLGRFTIPDWAAKPTTVPYASFGNPQTLNLYSYVGNNPTTQGDPDGHCYPFCDLVAKAASWVGVGVATQGGKQFSKNVGIGIAKGTGSFVVNTVKGAVAAGQVGAANIGGAVSTMMTPNPSVLQPSNQTQAQVSTATQVTLTVASVVVPAAISASGGGAASEVATTTVSHFTSDAGMAAISESGALRAGTFVTTTGEIPAGATSGEVESLLEIGPGKGANSLTFDTPNSNLVVPENGPTTSGGAAQFQLKNPTPIDPTKFKPTPPSQ
jgi:RHS repeat-associated protein